MKIISALFTAGSGKLGGIVASHNAGGNYLRALVIPTDPATALQIAVRNAMTILSAGWLDDLTDAQRDQWNTYAANTPVTDTLGQTINISGLNQYQRTNVPRLQAGVTRLDTAPTVFNYGSFTDPSFTIDTANDEVDVGFADTDAWANETDSHMLVYGSLPQNQTKNFFKGPYRLLGTIDGDDATAPTSPAALALSVPYVAGQRGFFRIRVSRVDGRLSGQFRGSGVAP